MKEDLPTSACQSVGSLEEFLCGWGNRNSWWCFVCAQVGNNKALVVGHHQKRNEMGLLQQSKPEMFLTRDVRYEVSGGEVWRTVPSGILFTS
jgi:hypothetical protein